MKVITCRFEFRDAIRLSGGECNTRIENKLNKINKLSFRPTPGVLGAWRVSRRYTLYTYKPSMTGGSLILLTCNKIIRLN